MTATFIDNELATIKAMLHDYPADKPVVMLNLLRFAQQANFKATDNAEPCSGMEAFMHYSEGVSPLIEKAGGAVIWQGRQAAMLIGPSDKNWELVVLVRYPSARAFVEMISSDAYQKVAFYRSAALVDSRLIAHQEF
ncbi:DUF1330 domain-containing protein [Halieaceae bacterium IMCC14734]|uniref:DUF1330 domain-containing protein n=1 Tax=Candidatus Litorirhabdus singularis TaxID=2518993 RepID=A0ABT3TBR5_9GAMM|nr:DUF1330 domain-containing protein [Candidatus Litorirhabdus singularis]MCX2979706.1 DUF1330 domain-containing protein [Candidatus Litorirhabdus singularis]